MKQWDVYNDNTGIVITTISAESKAQARYMALDLNKDYPVFVKPARNWHCSN